MATMAPMVSIFIPATINLSLVIIPMYIPNMNNVRNETIRETIMAVLAGKKKKGITGIKAPRKEHPP